MPLYNKHIGGITLMSQFTTKLNVEPIGNNKWILIEGFEYHVGCYPSDEIITVSKGFITVIIAVSVVTKYF